MVDGEPYKPGPGRLAASVPDGDSTGSDGSEI